MNTALTSSTMNQEPRNCPHCDTPPTHIYPPRTYTYNNGRTQTVHQAYCSGCQANYSPYPKGRRTKRTPKPKPIKTYKLTNSYTLEEITHLIDTNHPTATRWLTSNASNGRWGRLRELILERDHNQCQIQGPTCTTTATQVDHITPRLEGGNNHPHNLRASCGPCNASRYHWETRICADCGSHNIERITT